MSIATIIWFRELDKWSIPKSLRLAPKLPRGWVWEKIEKVVKQIDERVKVETESEYKLIGVRWYGEGTFHRETVTGKEISATYLTPVKPGAFIYNRLFAWKTSFAVVPKEHDGFFVSNEFPQFVVDETKILVEFLYLIFRLERTVKLVTSSSSGSAAVSRNRFKENEFLKFEIALPSLGTQQAIIDRWRNAKNLITQAEEEIIELEEGIEKQFFVDLGLKVSPHIPNLKVFAARWKDFERWSVSYNQAILSSVDISKGKYPIAELGEILSMLQYGSSEKASSENIGIPVIRMNNIVNGVLDLSDLKYIRMSQRDLERLLLKDGDILFNRTNSKELVGKCAVFHEKENYIFASYLIRVRAEETKADPDYISFVLNNRIGRQQINALSRQIIGQANVNSQELRSLKLPLPPLKVQQEIMAHIESGRAEIARQKEFAKKIRKDSEAEIEALILGTKKI
jgi:type I restriction enzyme, S subunit